jgi:hypothetical protein
MTVSQTDFAATLLDPARAVPAGLVNPDGTPASKRFDVYRNNVAVGLSDALETAFPVVRKLVGEAFFRAMAVVYLRQHPPTTPLMMFYGADMPTFLATFPPVAKLPYLPDVARLELALRQSYHAADAAPVDPALVAGLTEESRLSLAPAVRIVASDWPIHGIYRANTADVAQPAMAAETVLLMRKEFDPQLNLIDSRAAAFLNAVQDNATLGEAIEAAGEGFDLGPLLGLLLGRNAITAIF